MAEFMSGMKRTHYCGVLRSAEEGKEVTVCGWAQRQRDLGGLIFIDLRDRTGIVQLAFDDATDRAVFDKAFTVRAEFVLAAKGVVRERSSKNTDIPTGDIEVAVTELRILSKSETPPFAIEENSAVQKETRLHYRFLDLRRPDMQRILIARHRLTKIAHDYFDDNGFLEIETPDLMKSTPEGARDYLVPSRIFPGKFFALPQSPQLYKQLLMVSGFDRYMQIARCFRDEDLRADRQPEFTQIDFEMSFVTQEDVMEIGEGFIHDAYKKLLGVDIAIPLPRMTWHEAMNRFGSDKPDLRFGMELTDVSEVAEGHGIPRVRGRAFRRRQRARHQPQGAGRRAQPQGDRQARRVGQDLRRQGPCVDAPRFHGRDILVRKIPFAGRGKGRPRGARRGTGRRAVPRCER